MTDQMIVDMFDETAIRADQVSRMSGIMGVAQYDEFEREQIYKLLESLELDTSGRILDAGAGIGRNIPVLKKVGFTDIVAVDFSQNMLNCLKEAHPDVPAYKTDLEDLNIFPDDHFYATFVMYVFIHIVDDAALQRVITELERVTAGPLIIGQVMDQENKAQHRVCRVREYFEMHHMFKKKRLDHFYKNLYEFPVPNSEFINRVSFAIFR